MAKLAKQARRYEDMAIFMETLVINFIPTGDKPLSTMLNLHVFSKDTNNNKEELHFRYKSEIGSKLSKLCTRIMKILRLHLMPMATTDELRVFYLKMEWDYQQYMAEFKSGHNGMEIAKKSTASYLAAEKTMDDGVLQLRHPTRLS